MISIELGASIKIEEAEEIIAVSVAIEAATEITRTEVIVAVTGDTTTVSGIIARITETEDSGGPGVDREVVVETLEVLVDQGVVSEVEVMGIKGKDIISSSKGLNR